LIGLVALVAITVSLVTLRFDLLWRTPVTVESGFTPHQLLVALGVLLGVSISGLVASFIIKRFQSLPLLPHKFPAEIKLIEIAAALTFTPRIGPRHSCLAVSLSRISQLSPPFSSSLTRFMLKTCGKTPRRRFPRSTFSQS